MEPARPDLRPLGIGEMVDGALRLYRTNFLTLIKISAVVLGPLGVLQLIATIMAGPIDIESFLVVDPNATPAEALAPLVPIYTTAAIISVFAFIGSVLVQAASITAFAQVYQGIEPDWRASLRAGGSRFLALAASTILLGLGSTLGLLFCIIPGVFFFISWSVSPAALMTERLGPVAALSRSRQLVRGRFWPVFGAIILSYLLYSVASQIVSTVASVVTVFGTLNSGAFSLIPSVLASVLVSILATPFLAAMVTIIYFDLRVRHEGYDLELMAADLHRMEPSAESPTSPGDDHPFGLDAPDGT